MSSLWLLTGGIEGETEGDLEELEHDEHELVRTLAVLASCLLACFIVEAALHHYSLIGNWLPASGAFIIIGVAVGAFILIWDDRFEVAERYGLNIEIFDFILLPPIIFDGAYSMKQLYFWRNIGRICLFAVGGTCIATLVTTIPTFYLGSDYADLYPQLPLALTIAFAGLISAVDPVAALAVYGALGVNERLYAMVFGESMMNDAVAIVIYRVAADLIGVDFDGNAAVDAIIEFLKASIASVAIGVGIACLAALVLKYLRFIAHMHIVASVFIWTVGFTAFVVADAATCSGIVATLFCGFAMRHYAFYNLTEESQNMSIHLSHQVATFTETAIYLQLGFSALGLRDWNASFIILTVVWINLGRALNIFPLSVVINMFSATEENPRINFREQCAMFHAGLRGAIALALAVTLPHEAAEWRDMIITCTLIVVIWTVFFNGGTTVLALRILRIEMEEDLDEAEAHARHCEACASASRAPLTTTEVKELRIDNSYIRPFLTYYDPNTAEDGSHRFGHPESEVSSRVKNMAAFI